MRKGDQKSIIAHISDLKPDPSNARRHNPRNIGMIGDSLQEVGAARSIVIDEDNVILAGNGVVEAAAERGIEKIQVIDADGETIIAVRRTGLTPEQKTRLALWDNRAAETADWDAEVLASLLQEDEAILKGLFEKDELAELLKGLEAPKEAPEAQIDKAEELQEKWQCKRGQLWQIGKHRLLCGDSTSAEDVARLMGGEKAVLMATDPPYGVELDQGWRDRIGLNRLGHAQDDKLAGDDNCDWVEAYRLANVDVGIVWHAGIYAAEVKDSVEQAGYEVLQQIIWLKNMAPLSRQYYHWKHEPAWFIRRKGRTVPWHVGRDQTTVWEAASPKHIMSGSTEEKCAHPTQKPVELFVIPIRNHTLNGALVYDPFLGSGTTMVAAEQIGRVCFGIEIAEKYCAVVLQRMCDMGLDARLID